MIGSCNIPPVDLDHYHAYYEWNGVMLSCEMHDGSIHAELVDVDRVEWERYCDEECLSFDTDPWEHLQTVWTDVLDDAWDLANWKST